VERSSSTGASEADWTALEDAPEFQELVAARRRVVVSALVVFAVWFGGFLVLAAFARGFLGHTIYRGFTVAYALALSLILMTWLIAGIYIRFADRLLEPLAARSRADGDPGARP